MMVGDSAESAQPVGHFGGRGSNRGVGGIAQDPDAAIDRERAGGPPVATIAAEPEMRQKGAGHRNGIHQASTKAN